MLENNNISQQRKATYRQLHNLPEDEQRALIEFVLNQPCPELDALAKQLKAAINARAIARSQRGIGIGSARQLVVRLAIWIAMHRDRT